VNVALTAKGVAEKKHADAQWAYSEAPAKTTELREKVDAAFLELYKAKAAVENKKEIAKAKRIIYARLVADIEAKNDSPINMKGLDTDGQGTGIPGGLDAIGIEAATIFLPGTKLSEADVNFELNKLKIAYKKRKNANEEWEASQIQLSEAGDSSSQANDLVLRDRTKKRLEGAKKKTDDYLKTVKDLYKTYEERFRARKLNRFQWE
jgi:hypothetical protein